MDEDAYKELINAIGVMSELCLLFYRNTIEAGATEAEAASLTSALITSIFNNGKSKDQNPNS